ncbi:hypothetical protein Ciccas_005309 [Cichlidogyrus casuarinus]|uniref:Serpin domain-containing protein n=1 Tax=Cichlidogyrus casuarinus TaxID=1844966 RepID=A0ABD2QCM6_9PLAT
MIGKHAEFPYFRDEDNGYHVINLPFKGFLVMANLNGVKKRFTPLHWIIYDMIVKKMQINLINFRIPKFKVYQRLNLKPILKSYGVGDLFRSRANLSGIAGSIHLTAIEQVAPLELNEYGLHASAPSTEATKTVSRDSTGIDFFCDKPFLYVLYDSERREIILIGQYNRPSDA